MDDLIEALTIFKKYVDKGSYAYNNPFHCEPDVLSINGLQLDLMAEEDVSRLNELGFFYDHHSDSFQSYRFGSC